MTRIFITSDTHFFHNNILQYSARPFKSVEHMNEVLIYNWNKVVSNTDIVYHLGDVAINQKERFRKEILPKLNGKIVFIKGNHDPLTQSHIQNMIILFKNKQIELVHKPSDATFSCKYIIHGHIHRKSDGGYTHPEELLNSEYVFYNANCELHGYKPKLLNEIIGEIESDKQKIHTSQT